MELYKGFLRALLFRLPADGVQSLAEFVFRRQFVWRSLASRYTVKDKRLNLSLAGVKLENPVGLASGYDKDCRFLPSMAALGFGYLVGGTVTLEPCPGNPKPRVTRYPEQLSLVNSMGFPSQGARAVASRLQAGQGQAKGDKPLLLSIGGVTVEEFLGCHRILEPLVDGIELNISSPNTQGLRVFQEPPNFINLVEKVNQQRRKPLFVKLPPYFHDQEREGVLNLVRLCQRLGVDGVTAINTKPVSEPRLKVGSGGLSGKPLYEDMLRIVRELYTETGGKLPINACGGIFTPEDALKALDAGATTVQVFTAIVYEGPDVVRRLNQGLVRLLEERGVPSVDALINSPRGLGH